jgi:hypothetical protein
MGGANHFPWGKYLPLPSKQCQDSFTNKDEKRHLKKIVFFNKGKAQSHMCYLEGLLT